MNEQDRLDIVRALEHMIETGCKTADCHTRCNELILIVRNNRTTDFHAETLGLPFAPDPVDDRLREFAVEYHRQCESFDRMIAPGGIPRDGYDSYRMSRHASHVRNAILKKILPGLRKRYQQMVHEVGKRG